MKRKRLTVIAVCVMFAILLLTALDSRLRVVTYEISSEKITAPVRLAVLTDLHSCDYGEGQRELLDAVAQRCAVPIIASGGAGKMDDFKELFLNHPRVDAGLAASIFHTKQVDIRDLKLYLRENGVEMRV